MSKLPDELREWSEGDAYLAPRKTKRMMDNAADRIEQLEAALRTLIASCDNGAKMQKIGVSGMAVQTNIQSSWVNNVEAWAVNEARAALEGKDG